MLRDKIVTWGGPFLGGNFRTGKIEAPIILGYKPFQFNKSNIKKDNYSQYIPINAQINKNSILYINLNNKEINAGLVRLVINADGYRQFEYVVDPKKPIFLDKGKVTLEGIRLFINKNTWDDAALDETNEIILDINDYYLKKN